MTQGVMLRTSERTTFKTCRQQWWWAYEEKLKPIGLNPNLAFGSLIHNTLEKWYIPGKVRANRPLVDLLVETHDEMVEAQGVPFPAVKDNDAGERVEALDLGVEMMSNYYKEFGTDDWIEVIEPEQAFQIDIYDDETEKYLFTYTGEMDAVIRDLRTMRIGLFEHKTGASLDPFGAPIALDEQASAYWTFGAMYYRLKSGSNEDFSFVLFNRLRKAFGDNRPKNDLGQSLNKPTKQDLTPVLQSAGISDGILKKMKLDDMMTSIQSMGLDPLQLGKVSKNQPLPLFKRELAMRSKNDRVIVYNRVLSEAREMRLIRQGKLDVYKNPGKHCGYCPFRDMCEVHETGSDWEVIRDNSYVVWNPYEVHEEGR